VTVKQNGIVHRYDRLGPDERFRAAMEAAARDDDQERERLVATCPRRHYVMTEAGFTDRVDAAHDMAVAAALALGPQLTSLRMSAAVRETLPHAVALGVDVGAAGDEGPTSDDVREVVAETLDQALDQAEALLRSEAAAVYAAFSAVCRHEMQSSHTG
jgi:hypothetical protein